MGLADRHRTDATDTTDAERTRDVRADEHPDRARRREPVYDRDRAPADDHARTDDRVRTDDHVVADDHDRTRAIEEPVVVRERRSGAAVAALILGLLALLISVVPIVGLVGSLLGVIAIVLGAIGVSRSRSAAIKGAGMAVTGIVAGILSLVLGAVGIALFGEAVNELEGPATDLVEDVQTEIEDTTSG